MNPDLYDEVRRAFTALTGEAKNRRNAFRESPLPKIHIGMATCGIASGALETQKAFEDALSEYQTKALLKCVGCMGHCYAEPVVVIENPGFPAILYYKVTAGKARMIVKSFLLDGDPLFEHLLGAMEENDLIPPVADFPRFSREKKVVTEKCGLIDPEDIYDYIASGGYAGFLKAFQIGPQKLIQEVENSAERKRRSRVSH
jgi:NADH-quinone oxidoreductase subunit F